jgi:thioredoxin 1
MIGEKIMNIIHLANDNLNEVLNNNIVLVDFYAEWCGPCKMLGPILETLANELNDVSIVKIDVDTNPKTAEQYGIMSIPALILFKNGKPVSIKQGFQSKEMLKKWIEENR